MKDWYIGQQIVCINDTVEPNEPGPFIQEGRVYTISGFEDCRYTGEILLVLEELPHGNIEEWYENTTWTYGYNPACFRPLKETKADKAIEILEDA